MSNAVRGHAVEDTAATILHLDGGAIVTITLSDTAASPWSWDQTSREARPCSRPGRIRISSPEPRHR